MFFVLSSFLSFSQLIQAWNQKDDLKKKCTKKNNQAEVREKKIIIFFWGTYISSQIGQNISPTLNCNVGYLDFALK